VEEGGGHEEVGVGGAALEGEGVDAAAAVVKLDVELAGGFVVGGFEVEVGGGGVVGLDEVGGPVAVAVVVPFTATLAADGGGDDGVAGGEVFEAEVEVLDIVGGD